ncbi:head-tail adaptor protein [Aureimonas altamirensis]|uniref:head-tail adaptor protein n=1 Tax=Aureimonas altamirensis TaxID=370622 RepID=UPI0030159F13
MAEQLFERVAWSARIEEDDGYGNTQSDWQDQFETRAAFTYLRGSESVIAARLEGRQPIIVRVRSSSDTRKITTDWQMRDVRAGTIHAVRSIIPTEDRMWIDITTETGVAS